MFRWIALILISVLNVWIVEKPYWLRRFSFGRFWMNSIDVKIFLDTPSKHIGNNGNILYGKASPYFFMSKQQFICFKSDICTLNMWFWTLQVSCFRCGKGWVLTYSYAEFLFSITHRTGISTMGVIRNIYPVVFAVFMTRGKWILPKSCRKAHQAAQGMHMGGRIIDMVAQGLPW